MLRASWLLIPSAVAMMAMARPAKADVSGGNDQSSMWHMRATFAPPFARVVLRNGEDPSPLTTRLGFGVRAPNGVVGGRGALTRWASGGNGLELGLELSLSVPFAKDEPKNPYYGDGPTHAILEAGLYIAWLIEAPS